MHSFLSKHLMELYRGSRKCEGGLSNACDHMKAWEGSLVGEGLFAGRKGGRRQSGDTPWPPVASQ